MAELMYITFLNRLSRQRVTQHILFWLAALVFFNFVFRDDQHPIWVLVTSLGFLPGHLIFVYGLNYFLFPRYVLKGRIIPAIFGLALIVSLALFYLRVADVYLLHHSGRRHLWAPDNFPRSIYALFSIGWIAVTLKLVRGWYEEKERQQQLEKEKLTVELQLLKSQIHPHFLFNTLNSLYAFTLEKSDKAPQLVLKLSALLRYILYECNTSRIPLNTEIEIIKSYLALENMRFGNRLECSLQFSGDIENKTIAPLLLLPFVENSIKHGVSKQVEKSWISLHLHVADDTIQFKLINSREEHAAATVPPGGLGLHNVEKRLELLYPKTHTLKYTTDEDTWQVNLIIQLAPPQAQEVPQAPQPHPSTQYETQVSYR